MAKYKAEHGFEIKHRSSDPSNPIEGEIWYNTTTQKLKLAPQVAAWASGGAFGSNATTGIRSAGTLTAGLGAYGRGDANSSAAVAEAWEYDGSSWTAGGDANTARAYVAGCGTQTAAIYAGGYDGEGMTESEEYNGSSWAEGDDLNTGRWYPASTGSQTAAVQSLGVTPGALSNATEEYNGSSWTSVTNHPAARRTAEGAFGPQTAAVFVGNNQPPYPTSAVEHYDGTNWTAGGSFNTARGYLFAFGASQTAGVIVGGTNPSTTRKNVTEEYDGTSWTTNPATLAGARHDGGAAGTNTAGFIMGGNDGSNKTTTTEEWTKAATVRSVDTT